MLEQPVGSWRYYQVRYQNVPSGMLGHCCPRSPTENGASCTVTATATHGVCLNLSLSKHPSRCVFAYSAGDPNDVGIAATSGGPQHLRADSASSVTITAHMLPPLHEQVMKKCAGIHLPDNAASLNCALASSNPLVQQNAYSTTTAYTVSCPLLIGLPYITNVLQHGARTWR